MAEMNYVFQGGKESSTHFLLSKEECDPLITIITSTFNAESELKWTIDSIRKQSFQNFQWIIADGGSTDGTRLLLEENEDVIDFWFSESDKGIYDAWQKALQHARGEWIQFIGAGDELAAESTLSDISKHLIIAYPKFEIVYGNIEIISEKRRQLIHIIGEPWDTQKHKWHGLRPALPTHPEVFHHKSIFKDLEFSHYKVVGDSFIMLSSILKKDPLYVDILIDRMPHGGVSTKPENVKLIYNELNAVNRVLKIKPPFRNKCIFAIKALSKYLILKYLGYRAFLWLGDVFRVLTFKGKKWTVE